MSYEIPKQITHYMEQVETGKINACKDQHQVVALVRRAFAVEDIYVDEKQLENYLSLVKYFPYEQLFSWEVFCLGLHLCVYRKADGMPRWPDLFMLIGRGAGKDGFIAFESICVISKFNGINNYDVDICANSEVQAKQPFDDVLSALEAPEQIKKLKLHFYWNKENIVSLKTKSRIKYRTNNPKGKDGLRSGIVWFNEIHQYQDYLNINVFTTGLGKKKHPRRGYATTNGDVRDGPLDDMLATAIGILEGGLPDNGMLPFICRLDDKSEVDDPAMWEKANPSLPYLPNLQEEIKKEYIAWKQNPMQFTAFMTKRMNRPEGDKQIQVTSWDNILTTKRDVPDLTGMVCVGGIDYAKVSDIVSAGLLFRIGDMRYWITHSWLCAQSPDIPRLKIPWREWEKAGYLTVVDDVEINPNWVAEWFAQQGTKYHIVHMALDNYRYALMSSALSSLGFSAKENKNVKLVRPSDQMMISPIIESCFTNHQIVWGDNPLVRWATNNTKMIQNGSDKDKGNWTYGKIEPKSRKTDPFMAFVAAMTIESYLGSGGGISNMADIDVWTC